MIDFTSALYLGLRHPHSSSLAWRELTTGKPAALETPREHHIAAQAMAQLQGCDAGLLAPSTLHLFWDLFAILADADTLICIDEGAYSVMKWGVERAMYRGIAISPFRHYDPDSLAKVAARNGRGKKLIVAADGLCPACGVAAPVAEFLEVARKWGGLLVLDDTQGLGILGSNPAPDHPYGMGGGGTLRCHGLAGPDIIVVSSLAKAFGAPIALLGGSVPAIRRFASLSSTRVHCSPPSAAALSAAMNAFAVNEVRGDFLRRRLVTLAKKFKEGATAAGIRMTGNLLPVQTVKPQEGLNVMELHKRLLKAGIRTFLQQTAKGNEPILGFILTADKTFAEIDAAADLLKCLKTGSGTKMMRKRERKDELHPCWPRLAEQLR